MRTLLILLLVCASTASAQQPRPLGVFMHLSDDTSAAADASLPKHDGQTLIAPEPAGGGRPPLTLPASVLQGRASKPSQSKADLIARGRKLFLETCTECHEAEVALEKHQSIDEWLATIAEMAAQEDAVIPKTTFLPIATYLASLPAGPSDRSAPPAPPQMEEVPLKSPMRPGEDSSARPRFAPEIVARGQTAFQASCTKCHDADRSLSKRKSLAGWLATVRRMARLDGAQVAAADIQPIATYLASRHSTEQGGSAYEDAIASTFDTVNLSGTLSTLWRGGNDNLENPNFFVDAWVRIDWQPEGPLRGRVTTCTSCHSDHSNGAGFTLELVEATATLDLVAAWHGEQAADPNGCERDLTAELTAGRFVVPFGAFHAMSHPGVYRTVTNPLMFNMGRQVNPDNRRPPVVPMPYSDEGVNLHVGFPISCNWEVTLDGYAVNGLQTAGIGANFTNSRAYHDNNEDAGYGGRVTLRSERFQFGGSVMAGRMEETGLGPQNYHLAGADATARLWDDNVRLYFEYAMRRDDTIFPERLISHGIVAELEFVLLERPHLNGLVRYDTLEHSDFFGDTSIERFTWGVSTSIRGSQLILNHEHWNFPTDASEDVDVLGLRWVSTF